MNERDCRCTHLFIQDYYVVWNDQLRLNHNLCVLSPFLQYETFNGFGFADDDWFKFCQGHIETAECMWSAGVKSRWPRSYSCSASAQKFELPTSRFGVATCLRIHFEMKHPESLPRSFSVLQKSNIQIDIRIIWGKKCIECQDRNLYISAYNT